MHLVFLFWTTSWHFCLVQLHTRHRRTWAEGNVRFNDINNFTYKMSSECTPFAWEILIEENNVFTYCFKYDNYIKAIVSVYEMVSFIYSSKLTLKVERWQIHHSKCSRSRTCTVWWCLSPQVGYLLNHYMACLHYVSLSKSVISHLTHCVMEIFTFYFICFFL